MTGLSVVIACRDRGHLLEACLASLHAVLRESDEVVVVDAASRSSAVGDVARAAGALVVRLEEGGASGARNAGWQAARHRCIAFIDDDCRVTPGWPEAVVAALGELDAVCGKVVPEGDGHLSLLEVDTPSDYAPGVDPALLGHGANVAARQEALERVGGWDARLGPGTRWPGAEDKDLLLRLLAAGCAVGYRPQPVVRHLQWRSRRQSLKAELGYARGVGALAAKGIGPSARSWARAAATAAVADLRAGYQYGAVAGTVRVGGIVWGRLTAARVLADRERR